MGALQSSYRNNQQLQATNTLDIATLHDGSPAISALTFQGFDGEVLEFHLDTRSDVAHDLRTDPRCEIIWHFPLTRETFRLRQPEVAFVADSEALIRRWRTLTKPLKERYWSLAPDTYKSAGEAEQFTAQEGYEVSAHFSILRVRPTVIHQTIFKAPEVVAESRKKHSDRIPVPERRSKKWEHKLIGDIWETRELNISGSCA